MKLHGEPDSAMGLTLMSFKAVDLEGARIALVTPLGGGELPREDAEMSL